MIRPNRKCRALGAALSIVGTAQTGFAQESDIAGAVFTHVRTNTIQYEDGPSSVIAWNAGVSVVPRGRFVGGIVMAGGASGSSSKAGVKTRFDAFSFGPGVQIGADSTAAVAPFLAAGVALASGSATVNPREGETFRASGDGIGAWAQAGVVLSPDETLEFGVVGTYSHMAFEIGDRRVNAGGLGFSGRIGIRFGHSSQSTESEFVDAPGSEPSPALFDPTGAEKRDFWASRPPTQSKPSDLSLIESQTGVCEIKTLDEGVREARLQELIALDLVDGGTMKGTLDAVTSGTIQIRTQTGEHFHILETDVRSFTQF